jgi:hypothetical protein
VDEEKAKLCSFQKMRYKGGNTFKGLEVVNQVNDTFRYLQMKKSDPEPVFPRQR